MAAPGWTNASQILELNQQPATGAGSTMVFVDTTVTINPSGCSQTKGFYFVVNDERKKRIFAMLLTAQMASRSIKIYTTGNCHASWGFTELDGLVVN